MSSPEKKRGFRKIVIDGKEFSWRFNSQVEINPSANKANKLFVDIGWVDPFLNINEESTSPFAGESVIATPSLTKQAIEFALSHNWDITKKVGAARIAYKDGQFSIVLQPKY